MSCGGLQTSRLLPIRGLQRDICNSGFLGDPGRGLPESQPEKGSLAKFTRPSLHSVGRRHCVQQPWTIWRVITCRSSGESQVGHAHRREPQAAKCQSATAWCSARKATSTGKCSLASFAAGRAVRVKVKRRQSLIDLGGSDGSDAASAGWTTYCSQRFEYDQKVPQTIPVLRHHPAEVVGVKIIKLRRSAGWIPGVAGRLVKQARASFPVTRLLADSSRRCLDKPRPLSTEEGAR